MNVSLPRPSVARFPLFLLPLLLLTACGDDDDPTAPTPTASGPISVIVGDDDGELAPGVAVLHHDASGGVMAETSTDANGRAAFEIRSGDMVTVRTGSSNGGSQRLFTIGGVEPDDALDLRQRSFDPGSPSHNVVVNGTIPDPQDVVLFGTPCSHGGGGVTLPFNAWLRDTCESDSGLFHFQIFTRLGNEKQAFASVTDVVLDADGTTEIDLPATWRTDWQDVEFVAPDPGFVFESASMTPFPERDGSGYHNLESWDYEGPASLEGHVLRMIPGFAETVRLGMRFDADDRQFVADVRMSVDEATTRLAPNPPTPSIVLDPPDFSNPLRPRLRWSVDHDGVAGDYVLVAFFWRANGEFTSWEFYLPPSARSLRVPELPAGFFVDFPVGLDATNGLSVYAEFVDDEFLDGFDAARARVPYRANAWTNESRPGRRLTTSTWWDSPGFEGLDRSRGSAGHGGAD